MPDESFQLMIDFFSVTSKCCRKWQSSRCSAGARQVCILPENVPRLREAHGPQQGACSYRPATIFFCLEETLRFA